MMVALGTLISATWILASNSWMQTPQGFEIVDGRVVPVDWLKVIFNPSFPYRLAHMVVAAYLATALFVGASGAWHLLKRRDTPAVRTMLSMAMWMVLIVTPVQIEIGTNTGSWTSNISLQKSPRSRVIGRTSLVRACRLSSSACPI
jgi:cytochrome d ubiquinol oxidase subunit I